MTHATPFSDESSAHFSDDLCGIEELVGVVRDE